MIPYLTWRYALALFLLTCLCGTAHELVHHFAAFAVCGEWGYKTFNSFTPACRTPWTLLATAAGPAFSFATMWWGWHLLRQPDRPDRALGLALIFASMPLNRLLFPLLGFNDEHQVAYRLLPGHAGARLVTEAVVLALGLPPLVAAWRALRGARRGWWLAGLLVLPFAAIVLTVGLGLEPLITEKRLLWQTVWGIPYLVLVFEVVCTVGYYRCRYHLWAPQPAPQPVPAPAELAPA